MSLDPAPWPEYAHLPLLVAPCGCTQRGRFASSRGCSVFPPEVWDTMPGSRLSYHQRTAIKKATAA